MMEYRLIRSRRKTIGLEVSREGELIVRAPLKVSESQIRQALESKRDWIARAMAKQELRRENHPEPDEATWKLWQQQAKAYIPPRVSYYARLMGVTPTRLRFTRARTRFGSCSGENAIMFSLRLMDYPQEAIDYVIVHELAHIRHKNHGPEFYAFVAGVMPDYKQRQKLLKV